MAQLQQPNDVHKKDPMGNNLLTISAVKLLIIYLQHLNYVLVIQAFSTAYIRSLRTYLNLSTSFGAIIVLYFSFNYILRPTSVLIL